MSNHARERGVAVQGILALIVLVAVIYLGYKIIPAFVNNYQFQDAVDSEAKMALINKTDEEGIRDIIFKKARSLDLPIKREQIKVTISSNGVAISCSYVIPIQLPGYTWNLHFESKADSRLL